MNPTKFRAWLYFAIAFLAAFSDKILNILYGGSWPPLPLVVASTITGLMQGLMIVRAYYDGSALRNAQEDTKGNVPIKTIVGLLLVVALLSGCSLNHQVPKAQIGFNPRTHQIDISSHKDVTLSNVVVKVEGTNLMFTIGYYTARSNIEVIKAAIEAQQQQIIGVQNGLEKIVGAAIDHAKP